MSILIVGAGATGGYFGARLASTGSDVRFLVRPARAAQLARDGLVLRTGDSIERTSVTTLTADELATQHSGDGPNEPIDVVLVAVKGSALAQVIQDIAGVVGPDTAIVPVLNGMRHLSMLNDAFGQQRVLGGVALLGTQLNDAGEIAVLMPNADLTIGAQHPDAEPLAHRVLQALSGAGFSVHLSDHIIEQMHSKWGFIAAAGAIGCLLGGTVGEVVAAGGAGAVEEIITEVVIAIAATGHPIAKQAGASWRSMFTMPGSPFASSLYRDLAQGRPVEVEEILADLIDHARHQQLPTPLLEATIVRLRVHNARLTTTT